LCPEKAHQSPKSSWELSGRGIRWLKKPYLPIAALEPLDYLPDMRIGGLPSTWSLET